MVKRQSKANQIASKLDLRMSKPVKVVIVSSNGSNNGLNRHDMIQSNNMIQSMKDRCHQCFIGDQFQIIQIDNKMSYGSHCCNDYLHIQCK